MNRLLKIATLALTLATAGSAFASAPQVFKTALQAARGTGARVLDRSGAVREVTPGVTPAQLNVVSRQAINSSKIAYTLGSKFNLGVTKVKVDVVKVKGGWSGKSATIINPPGEE